MADDNAPRRTRPGDLSGVFDEVEADGEDVLDTESLDALFELLADRRRREVLSYLATRDDDHVSLGELAAHVDERLSDSGSARQSAVRLHHVTLPWIAETGLITYDAADGRVECHRRPLLREFLSVLEDR